MSYIRLIPNRLGEKILRNINNKWEINRILSTSRLQAELLQAYGDYLPKMQVIVNHFKYASFNPSSPRPKIVKSHETKEYEVDTENVPKNFQHPKANTFIVFNKFTEIYRFKGKIKRKKLNKIISKHPKASVLVDLGNGLSKMIPIKTFKKLLQIQFIIFERDYEFCLPDEYEHESMNAIWATLPDRLKDYIYSINQLIYTLTIENSYNKAIESFMMAKFYLLVGQEKFLKILYYDGRVEQISLEDFLDKYELNASVEFL